MIGIFYRTNIELATQNLRAEEGKKVVFVTPLLLFLLFSDGSVPVAADVTR